MTFRSHSATISFSTSSVVAKAAARVASRVAHLSNIGNSNNTTETRSERASTGSLALPPEEAAELDDDISPLIRRRAYRYCLLTHF